jgi:6-phosphofructokinase 1
MLCLMLIALAHAVGDRDKVRLHTVEYESEQSAGAYCPHGIAIGEDDQCLVLPEWAIRCGPRKTIYHDPQQVFAAYAMLSLCCRQAEGFCCATLCKQM